MFGLEFTPATVIVGLLVAALAFLAVRRMWRNGMRLPQWGRPSLSEHRRGLPRVRDIWRNCMPKQTFLKGS